MNDPLYITGLAVLFGLLSLVIWEIYAFLTGNVATVSVFAEKLNKINPLIGYIIATIFGILIGHWFIPPGVCGG